jgi:hypothetical protein
MTPLDRAVNLDAPLRRRFWRGPVVGLIVVMVGSVITGLTVGPQWILRVGFPALFALGAWVLVLFVWSQLTERRRRLAQAHFPDAQVEAGLRAKRSISALWMLRSGGGEVLERAPRGWILVVSADAIEIWGGRLSGLERYARLPFSSVVRVEIGRVLDRREFHHCLLVQVKSADAPWPVPLLVLGGSPFGVGPAGPERLGKQITDLALDR